MTEDDLIAFKQACGLDPRAKITVSTLRAARFWRAGCV
jgi:hypothetical protein